MHMEVSEKEVELINYFRSISRFNRERIFAQARTAYEDYQRAQKVHDCVNGVQS